MDKKIKITLFIPESIRHRLWALKSRGIEINMTRLLEIGALMELKRLEEQHGKG